MISFYCTRRLIFQLSGLLYATVCLQVSIQKDMEVLCEVIQLLPSEEIEAAITPRVALVGYAKPVSDARYDSRRTGATHRVHAEIYPRRSRRLCVHFC